MSNRTHRVIVRDDYGIFKVDGVRKWIYASDMDRVYIDRVVMYLKGKSIGDICKELKITRKTMTLSFAKVHMLLKLKNETKHVRREFRELEKLRLFKKKKRFPV